MPLEDRPIRGGHLVPVYLAGGSLGIIEIEGATSSAVYNVTLTLADTEYSQVIPANCRAFSFQCRTAFNVRYQYVSGRVAGPVAPYMTMKSGGAVNEGPINLGGSLLTLYLASSEAGVVVEITAWV